MTYEQFCYWLQGRVELGKGNPTEEEWDTIRRQLSLTISKVSGPVGAPSLTFPPGVRGGMALYGQHSLVEE